MEWRNILITRQREYPNMWNTFLYETKVSKKWNFNKRQAQQFDMSEKKFSRKNSSKFLKYGP